MFEVLFLHQEEDLKDVLELLFARYWYREKVS